MNSKYKELIDKSKKFKKSFGGILVNTENYESKNTVEEKIIYLENLNDFITSKLNITDIDSLNDDTINKNLPSNLEGNKLKLLNKLIHKNIYYNFIDKLLLSETLNNLISNTSNDPKIVKFKDDILKQLDTLAKTNNTLMNITEEQNKLTEDITNAKINIKEAQKRYKERLTLHAEKKIDNNDNEKYKHNMLLCEKKLEKINFMRVLSSELLININPFGDSEEAINLLKKLRHPVTLESLKSTPDIS